MEAISEVGSIPVCTIWNDLRGAVNEQLTRNIKNQVFTGMGTDVGFAIYVVMTEAVKEALCQ